MTDRPEKTPEAIFSQANYRDFLRDLTEALKKAGASYRSLAQACGLGSPTYFQQVINGKRGLTPATARKIAAGLEFSEEESEYFLCMVKLEQDDGDRGAIEDKMRELRHQHSLKDVRDLSIHSTWLHGVVYELASIPDFALTRENIGPRLEGLATRAEIEESIEYLKKRRLIEKTGDGEVYRQTDVQLITVNDSRAARLDLQRIHEHYLKLAVHRLASAAGEREFQGLTMAIPWSAFPEVKEEIRSFMAKLRSKLAGLEDADDVLRVQLAAFKVTSRISGTHT